jgi:hypothetical protein
MFHNKLFSVKRHIYNTKHQCISVKIDVSWNQSARLLYKSRRIVLYKSYIEHIERLYIHFFDAFTVDYGHFQLETNPRICRDWSRFPISISRICCDGFMTEHFYLFCWAVETLETPGFCKQKQIAFLHLVGKWFIFSTYIQKGMIYWNLKGPYITRLYLSANVLMNKVNEDIWR